MRHAGPYGSMVAGLCALLFSIGATYGAVRVVLGTGASLTVATGFGALVAFWVSAYFSGDGHSVRRAVRGWWVAVASGGAMTVALWAVGHLEDRWVTTVWVVAWLLGACAAVGSGGRSVARRRVAFSLLLGIPAATGAVAIARIPVFGAFAAIAMLAAPLALADAVAMREAP